ncbi:hypothetical protein ACTI_74010 [Actinoplanes sp. OR16]|uniref:hypothetical protein n=1 Tax=Actinoplanes sp. OR16 TaxID=946334 RepID=UPI000F6C0BED|nr:hypothetical protein [Actinoplanes sp. OR16]BBH70716.1 hypothetical protein ACTI_74010 [Actinoplanes sp. OR16]
MNSWTAAQTAVIVVAVIAVLGSAISAAITYLLSQRAVQRERRAKAFAEALNAVEEFAELPYRVRRRLGTPQARHDLTEEISRAQSQLAYHQALLQIEAPEVAEPYRSLVRAVKEQAGTQMAEAWLKPALTTDTEMNLAKAYPRDLIDSARDTCIDAMRITLERRRLRDAPIVRRSTAAR